MKKLLIFTFFLIVINQCAQFPDLAKKFLGISSENDKLYLNFLIFYRKIDLCKDLH